MSLPLKPNYGSGCYISGLGQGRAGGWATTHPQWMFWEQPVPGAEVMERSPPLSLRAKWPTVQSQEVWLIQDVEFSFEIHLLGWMRAIRLFAIMFNPTHDRPAPSRLMMGSRPGWGFGFSCQEDLRILRLARGSLQCSSSDWARWAWGVLAVGCYRVPYLSRGGWGSGRVRHDITALKPYGGKWTIQIQPD